LFPRATSSNAIALTIESFNTYALSYPHWQISFSGGKDSMALVTVTIDLIERGLIPRPESLVVMYADTRLELPPLQASAIQVLKEVKKRGWDTEVVMAELDKRFFVYLLGRGVPPPNNSTLRWCTQQIKLTPMRLAMEKRFLDKGRVLSLNGVRIGESAIRDRRIAVSCSKNGSECGQGWFQRDLPDSLGDKLSPILHWNVCHIWDWLMLDAPRLGFDTELLAEVYGGDEAVEMNARTGCVGCPVASRDLALEYLVKLPQWNYLSPLLELRSIWHEARQFENRHQKVGEKKKNGDFSAAPNRKGPLTLTARKRLLEKILAIQKQVNLSATALGSPCVDLINAEEENRILELIEAKTFPNKWTGEEPTGDKIVPQYDSKGNIQFPLFS
jgi:DNA sulfur modification protein DndC